MSLSNNNLIKKSIPILKVIIGDIEPQEIEIDNDIDLDNIDFMTTFNKDPDDPNELLKYIDEMENNTLNHILLYLFEYSCENYFLKLKAKYNKNNENKDLYHEKIFNQNSSSFIFLQKSIKTYNGIEKNEITNDNSYINLQKLYTNAYIKRYITYYINIKMEDKYESDGLKFDKIICISNNDQNQPNLL